jgi:xylose isomerase
MDQYPYREDGAAAVRESVAFLQNVEALLTETRQSELRDLIAAGDATATTRYARRTFLAKL